MNQNEHGVSVCRADGFASRCLPYQPVQVHWMGFPSKFDEFIESSNLSSRVRPRSATAAIGPNGPESAATVCAMYARAPKSVQLCTSSSTAASADMSRSDLANGITSTELVCHTSVALKSHGRCWFDTDSESSLSDRDEHVEECDNVTQSAEIHDCVLPNPSSNVCRSPLSNDHHLSMVHESSTNISLSSSIPACNIDSQDMRSASTPQQSNLNEGPASSSALTFSREIFAPNVLPWFKAKRKSAQNVGGIY